MESLGESRLLFSTRKVLFLQIWEKLSGRILGIPLVFTGHSLGREKQRRLLAAGVDHKQIEQSYSISRRIDAEELTLAHANLIITSTKQEADQQYSRYGKFVAKQVEVIPPGVDSKRFNSLSSEYVFRME